MDRGTLYYKQWGMLAGSAYHQQIRDITSFRLGLIVLVKYPSETHIGSLDRARTLFSNMLRDCWGGWV